MVSNVYFETYELIPLVMYRNIDMKREEYAEVFVRKIQFTVLRDIAGMYVAVYYILVAPRYPQTLYTASCGLVPTTLLLFFSLVFTTSIYCHTRYTEEISGTWRCIDVSIHFNVFFQRWSIILFALNKFGKISVYFITTDCEKY